MIDFKIKPVLNPKGKRSQEGEAIYLCINRKTRHYINLHLEKIPLKAWSGKPQKWVNNQYPYAKSHNLIIAREIHHLKEIIQDYNKRNEILTSEKLKKVYEVKHQGKRIRGVNGAMAPGASDTIVSYIDYSLAHGAVSKKTSGTRKVYVTLRNLLDKYRSYALMADIEEGLILGFVEFLRSDATDIKSDTTVAKYVDRLKVIYREYCDQYGLNFKKRIFQGLGVDADKSPDKIVYVNDAQYDALLNLTFSEKERRLEITRDIFVLLCNTALYYNDLMAIYSISGFDRNLTRIDPECMVLQGGRKKNGEEFWIPLNETAKRIVKRYHAVEGEKLFPRDIAISEQKFNQHLKVLAERIKFTDVLSNKVGRKTFATWADRLGMEENDIRMIFGHSPGSVLKKYYTQRKTMETYQRILSFIQR